MPGAWGLLLGHTGFQGLPVHKCSSPQVCASDPRGIKGCGQCSRRRCRACPIDSFQVAWPSADDLSQQGEGGRRAEEGAMFLPSLCLNLLAQTSMPSGSVQHPQPALSFSQLDRQFLLQHSTSPFCHALEGSKIFFFTDTTCAQCRASSCYVSVFKFIRAAISCALPLFWTPHLYQKCLSPKYDEVYLEKVQPLLI